MDVVFNCYKKSEILLVNNCTRTYKKLFSCIYLYIYTKFFKSFFYEGSSVICKR